MPLPTPPHRTHQDRGHRRENSHCDAPAGGHPQVASCPPTAPEGGWRRRLGELIKATLAGPQWGRLRLVVQTGSSARESHDQGRPAPSSRRARGCGSAGRAGFSHRKYPHRFAYAHLRASTMEAELAIPWKSGFTVERFTERALDSPVPRGRELAASAAGQKFA